ncbi:MAG TPA: GGDEF domain-containing protein [Phenylobacterium sp.]|nr:GGDEF domain-containing protein [Phenylobacterium sp.]
MPEVKTTPAPAPILKELHAELAAEGEVVNLGEGAMLWHEGDPGDSVVLLLDGLLEIVNEPAEGEEVVLRTVEPVAVVGEIAADGYGRSAAVRARKQSRLLKVSATRFREILRRRPDVLEWLYWQQVARVRSLTQRFTRTHHRAITDPLTRLYNFGFFRKRLEDELARAGETEDLVSLVIFDIDHFKHYNDTNGHQEGNTVLSGVARILKDTGRRGDILARYGGEEFVALLYGATLDEAARFAESVREAIEKQPFLGGEKQPQGCVTISAGVATYPVDAGDAAALMEEADRRLYRAKEGGRNRVVLD